MLLASLCCLISFNKYLVRDYNHLKSLLIIFNYFHFANITKEGHETLLSVECWDEQTSERIIIIFSCNNPLLIT